MKTLLKLSVFMAAGIFLPAKTLNAQSWAWAKDMPSSSVVEAHGIATDNNRNNYVVTSFAGTATYGSTSLVSSGSYDVALSKMDEDGNYLWSVKVCAGTNDDHGMAVVCDPTGTEIYVTGYFSGTATFGSTVLTSAGSADVFLAKYNNAGTLAWAVSAGGTGYDQSVGISWARCPGICRGSYAFLTGTFSGTATFGTTAITSPTGTSVFTAMYGNTGSLVWVRQASATYNSITTSAITADAADNVYITGSFGYTGTFGSLSLVSAGGYDQFVLKYNSAGTEQWARKGGGTVIESGSDLRVDASGNVYVCGQFQSNTATYGSFTLTGTGSMDLAIVKYNSSGTEQWATKAASVNNDEVTGLALDAANNILITGTFEGPNLVMGSITLVADASVDAFVARLTPAGVFDKAISPVASPSYSTMRPHDISVTSLGHVFITGDYTYSFTFGSSVISSGGPQHGFVAKLQMGDWPFTAGGTNDDQVQNMDVDAAGNVYLTGFSGKDGFIQKLNTCGTPQWAHYGYNSGYFCSVESNAVISDASGNSFIAGRFGCSVTFGSTVLTTSAQNAAFLVKYDAAGAQQWALKVAEGLTGNVIVKDLAIDGSGNLYMTGGFYENAVFGSGASTVTLIGTNTNEDAFLAKYDNTGTLLWAVSAVTGTSRDEAQGVTLNGTNIIVSGMFAATATFGSASVTATSAGLTDMFVAKYNSSGVGQGVIAGGSAVNANELMYDVVSVGNSVYAAGTYAGSITFGGFPLTASNFDGILAKIDVTSMTVIWIREAKNSNSCQFRSVDATGTGVYVVGDFYGTTTFGDGITSPTLTPAGSDDVFMEKFDGSGNFIWLKQIGGIYDDASIGAGMDASENAYIGGNYLTSIDINGVTYPGAGNSDYYAQKFAFDDGTFARLAASDPVEEETQSAITAAEVLIHPNPFSEYTTLEIPSFYEGAYTLVLYDISGRIVRTQQGEHGTPLIVAKKDLAPGIYTWHVFTKSADVGIGKMIIQ